MKRHEAMPPRFCYEQPVARHRLHAMVTSASLRCLWVAARHRVRRCTGSTPPSSLPGGCTDCASFRASQSARWRKRLWLPPKTAHSRQPPSPPSSPQLHHHRICHRRRRRRQKLLVLDTVVMRRCRVRLCVPRRGRRAIGRVGARRFDAAGACVVQAPEDGCHKQQQQRQEAAHVDAAAARSVVMPLSRAAAVCVPPPCHL